MILAGLSPDAIEATEQALSMMKDNIRQATVDRDEAELAVGVFDPVEAAPPRKTAGRRG